MFLGKRVIQASDPCVGIRNAFAGSEVIIKERRTFAGTIGSRPVIQDVFRDGIDAIGGNAVASERISDVFPGIVGIGPRGRWIVDRDRPARAIQRLREVALCAEGRSALWRRSR